MYLAVTMIILGEALVAGSAPLVAYWAVWFVAVNVFVMGFEEPTLRRQFGPVVRRLHGPGAAVDSEPATANLLLPVIVLAGLHWRTRAAGRRGGAASGVATAKERHRWQACET